MSTSSTISPSERAVLAQATGKNKGAKSQKIQAVKGMNDIIPSGLAPTSQNIGSQHWEWLEQVVRNHLQSYGYQNIRTPIVEPTALFERGTGQTTDIVEKEMYAFTDRMNGDELCLRPENTPGVVRSAIEHNLTYNGGQRVYYIGPMFRHERPQRGRYRQFHQLGAEALGFAGPQLDAELMIMAYRLFMRLGLQNIRVDINSLGVPAERKAHREALISHFTQHCDLLDEDAKRRLQSNPLRILDSKNAAMQEVVESAPRLLDFLGAASLHHFEKVKEWLSSAGVPWRVNPRLVRGLDYYSHTVFEFVSDELGAQGTVCGGGRYDGLFEILGGKPTPAVGWALGMERLLDLLHTQGLLPQPSVIDGYVVVSEAAYLSEVLPLLEQWRGEGLRLVLHASSGVDSAGLGSLKSQFKKADQSGARYALVFAEDEMRHQNVTVKPLRSQEPQKICVYAEVPNLLRRD